MAIVCFSIAFALNKIGWYNYSWWFGNIFSGMFFFIMGYWLKDKEDNTKLFFASIVTFGSVVLANMVGWILDFPYLYMHANKMYRGDYMLFYPMALAGIVMCNHGMRILYKYKDLCVLEYIGRNSMYLYVTHWILLTIITFISKCFFHVDLPSILFVILLCSSLLFLPVIVKLIGIVKNKYVVFCNII